MIYAETAEPFFREVLGFQLIAYFGWREATVACFSNIEINNLQVIFRFPIQCLERDYQRVQLRIDCEGNDRFSPGNLLYGMVYCSENTVDQRPRSVPYCRLVLLIRLVLFQYGYVADVPLDQTLRGQPTARRNHDLCGDFGEPFFREVNGSQMIAYFGWRG